MNSSHGSRSVALFGLSHRTAPVSHRERLALSSSRESEALRRLRDELPVQEGVIISTCNRVEIYSPLAEDVSPEILGSFLCDFQGVPSEEIRGMSYACRGPEAIRHLFRVASSLDSQVVGESQILSQVKSAYLRAKVGGHTGRTLNLLFQKALKVGKDVRTRTRIGERGASVCSVAIGFMRKIFEDLTSKAVMVIGSGEMGKLTLGQLFRQGARKLLIVNRSRERAEELASKYGGEVVPYEALPERLGEADIVMTSTAAPHPIIRADEVRAAMRQRRHAPQIYMDIAIPRDVEPEVGKIENVYLYNVDDLDRVLRQNMDECAREASEGEEIVNHQVEAYLALQARMDLGPAISRMRGYLLGLVRGELARALGAAPPLDSRGAGSVEALAERLVDRILQGPIQALRQGVEDGVGEEMELLVRRIFSDNGLDLPESGEESPSPGPERRAESKES